MHEDFFGTLQEKLGKRRFVVPIVAALLIGTLFALAVYPMTAASPKDLPFGIVSLDKGTEFNDEEINIGETLVGEIMGTNTDDEAFDPSEMAKEGTEKFVEGVGTLQSGLEKLAGAATTFSEGTAGVATGANALAQGTSGLVQGSAGVSASATGLVGSISQTQEHVANLSDIKTELSAAIISAKEAKDVLSSIDTSALDSEKKTAIETQINNLSTEITKLETAVDSLDSNISATEADLATLAVNAQKVAAGASGLQEAATSLNPLAQGTAMGTSKLAQGSSQLATMLGGVAEGTGALKEGAQNLSDMIDASLSSNTSTEEEEENALTDAVAWRVYDSQASLEEAVTNEELYVAIIVPENFSEALLDSKMGDGDAESLQIIINEAKSPMITNSIKPAITNLFGTQGIPYEITSINPIDSEGSMMPYAMMIATMPTFLTAIIATVLLYLLTKAPAGACRKEKLQVAAIRAVLIAILSGLVGFGLASLLHLYGVEVPVVTLGLFMWIASAALILLFLGLVSLAPPLGVLTILCCFGFGMTLATLPYEMLPTFYQEWVWPWAPQHFIGDGVRQIIYTGAGVINSSAIPLLIMAGVGLICLFLSALVPEIKREGNRNPLERLKAKKKLSMPSRKTVL